MSSYTYNRPQSPPRKATRKSSSSRSPTPARRASLLTPAAAAAVASTTTEHAPAAPASAANAPVGFPSAPETKASQSGADVKRRNSLIDNVVGGFRRRTTSVSSNGSLEALRQTQKKDEDARKSQEVISKTTGIEESDFARGTRKRIDSIKKAFSFRRKGASDARGSQTGSQTGSPRSSIGSFEPSPVLGSPIALPSDIASPEPPVAQELDVLPEPAVVEDPFAVSLVTPAPGLTFKNAVPLEERPASPSSGLLDLTSPVSASGSSFPVPPSLTPPSRPGSPSKAIEAAVQKLLAVAPEEPVEETTPVYSEAATVPTAVAEITPAPAPEAEEEIRIPIEVIGEPRERKPSTSDWEEVAMSEARLDSEMSTIPSNRSSMAEDGSSATPASILTGYEPSLLRERKRVLVAEEVPPIVVEEKEEEQQPKLTRSASTRTTQTPVPPGAFAGWETGFANAREDFAGFVPSTTWGKVAVAVGVVTAVTLLSVVRSATRS